MKRDSWYRKRGLGIGFLLATAALAAIAILAPAGNRILAYLSLFLCAVGVLYIRQQWRAILPAATAPRPSRPEKHSRVDMH